MTMLKNKSDNLSMQASIAERGLNAEGLMSYHKGKVEDLNNPLVNEISHDFRRIETLDAITFIQMKEWELEELLEKTNLLKAELGERNPIYKAIVKRVLNIYNSYKELNDNNSEDFPIKETVGDIAAELNGVQNLLDSGYKSRRDLEESFVKVGQKIEELESKSSLSEGNVVMVTLKREFSLLENCAMMKAVVLEEKLEIFMDKVIANLEGENISDEDFEEYSKQVGVVLRNKKKLDNFAIRDKKYTLPENIKEKMEVILNLLETQDKIRNSFKVAS